MIVVEKAPDHETLATVDFSTEKQLEDVICRFPQLVARTGDAQPLFVSRQIQMSSGIMDVLLIDHDGLPIAVEVKLDRNPSRREVVAQLVDYVSTLTDYTVDELDEAVNGGLSIAIDGMVETDSERERIWRAAGANLRAGMVRYVILMDHVSQDLARIVRFLAKRSNLDVRMVEISQYVSSDQRAFFVPKNLVDEGDSGAEQIGPSSHASRARLQEVIEAYAQNPGALPLRGQAKNYRQILPASWPASVHYEFFGRAKSVSVEIHLEGAKVSHLAELLQTWENGPPPELPFGLAWDPNWKQGRISAKLPSDCTPAAVGKAMADLIAVTEPLISDALRTNMP